VRDRIVQQACRIVIEPIFEANFQNQSYGFRPKRSAAQAVCAVDKVLLRGWWVVDADIQGYLDSYTQCSYRYLKRLGGGATTLIRNPLRCPWRT
jgi:hypothetical protein